MQRALLSGRNAAVLDAVVERYIVTGEPVGSVTITRMLPERTSSATVRNVMAELERLGYLEQPHTSAGRMPTAEGYRRYVHGLLTDRRDGGIDETALRSRLEREDPVEVKQLLRGTCHLLAELSDLVGLVSAPPLSETVFQHIDFVALDGGRVLAIVVGRNGQVTNRVVSPAETVTQEQLDRAAEYLIRRFSGRSLREVAVRVRELLAEAAERLDVIEHQAIRLGAQSLDSELDEAEVLVEGTASLLSRRDFEAREDLQAVVETIEHRSELVRLLSPESAHDDPRVLIGAEPLPAALNGCAVVAATYFAGGQPLGSVAVLGPTRLHYARAIALVQAMARVTSTVFGRFAP